MASDQLGYLYGLAVCGGGLMGYVKKRSLPSLIFGLLFGVLALAGAYAASAAPYSPNSYIIALVNSAILFVAMVFRAIKSGKLAVAGVIATMSLIMACRYAFIIFTLNRS